MADTDQCCRINIEDDSSVEKEVNITVGFIQPLQLPPNIKLQKEAEVISIVDNDGKRIS